MNDQKHNSKRVRTRFAPSPTGFVHIGSVQKMIFAYATAKAFGGDYILRIEDTDQKRFVEGAAEGIVDAHKALGIPIDESFAHGGDYGPYKQSERLEIYQKYAEQLLESGHAYYAFDTAEELAEMRKAQQAAGERTRYNGKYRDYPLEDSRKRISAGEKAVVRIKLPELPEVIEAEDKIMGKSKVSTRDLDDYVLLKSDGFPTYHLAVVVDDHLMEISHVIRGVEWMPTWPIHILLYRYLGWDLPEFMHIPNILDPKGGKLSKRSGSVALSEFLAQGYLPEAINNFMMLLGWNPKNNQEIFDIQYLIDHFDFDKFNKSNPVFDRQKLDWFNQMYLRNLEPDAFFAKAKAWEKEYGAGKAEQAISTLVQELGEEKAKQALALEQERITTLNELAEKLDIFVQIPESYETHKMTKKLSSEQKQQILSEYLQVFGADFTELPKHEIWEQKVRGIVEKLELKAGQVFMSIRLAITGKAATPPLYEFIEIIGYEAHLDRIKTALDRTSAGSGI